MCYRASRRLTYPQNMPAVCSCGESQIPFDLWPNPVFKKNEFSRDLKAVTQTILFLRWNKCNNLEDQTIHASGRFANGSSTGCFFLWLMQLGGGDLKNGHDDVRRGLKHFLTSAPPPRHTQSNRYFPCGEILQISIWKFMYKKLIYLFIYLSGVQTPVQEADVAPGESPCDPQQAPSIRPIGEPCNSLKVTGTLLLLLRKVFCGPGRLHAPPLPECESL